MTSPNSETLNLDAFPTAVEKCLEEFFAQQRAAVDAIDPMVTQAITLLEDMVLSGGKRLRPMFAWVGYHGAGIANEDPAAVLRTVSALELIQACALIHDDIIDASDTRRGFPTIHRRVEAQHRERQWHGSAEHFGEAIAILVGDIALAWAEDMLYSSGLSLEALQRVRGPWSAMKTEVIAGQILDISVESSGDERVDIAEKINRFKTAAYTIERPLHIGAAIGQAPQPMIDAFRAYGHDIGIAYQLRDDLLGVFGDPEVTGKPAGDDIREGKRTVLLAAALAAADATNPVAAKQLRAGVGVAQDPHELTELAAIIRSTGAEDVVEKRITELTTTGLARLDDVELPQPIAQCLRDLAIRSTKRRA
ncbi:polyprenyl synthetase family protein [Corynebacterium epidermidicanis]|uniref:Geranylgeranyl pyrophosphate synthase n=1 Tax=Corynebacterium epidermidicanis TaxID=1050174 RepID=A0A0G3GSI2_9CORY|nr:polyprenyl synthetase family protein [Corynebacterium epidermidicanis]AKK03535.1 geranylgeranyl pyrophosphate synthase [Corynebacterium epidermidicanis]